MRTMTTFVFGVAGVALAIMLGEALSTPPAPRPFGQPYGYAAQAEGWSYDAPAVPVQDRASSSGCGSYGPQQTPDGGDATEAVTYY